MVLQQILGILLISGAIIFASMISGNNQVLSQAQSNKRAVLGASDIKEPEDKLFKRDVFFASGRYSDAKQFIEEQKIRIFKEDKVNLFPEPEWGLGFVIKVTRALPVTINDGGDEKIYRTFKTSVKDLLDEKGIELGDKDIIKPGLDSQLSREMTISIVRVSETDIKIKQKINFKTKYQDDPRLDKGLTRLVRAGKVGHKELTYRVRRENGREVSRRLIKTQILSQPVNKVVARGTKEVIYGTGIATWFGAPAMTAAHNSLPRGTMVRVTNLATGKNVVVKVIGGGIRSRAIIDLSPDAFKKLASLRAGVIKVKISQP